MVDMWFQDDFGQISRPASTLNNSQQCSQTNQMPSCHFEDDVFHGRVLDVLHQHAGRGAAGAAPQPLFLYWAAHACHGPREVPAATVRAAPGAESTLLYLLSHTTPIQNPT
jgi:hypothetical protein